MSHIVTIKTRLSDATALAAALEHWEGYRCPDCDRIRDPDDMDTCGACERRICNDCSGCCARCQEYFCKDCLERDRVAREEFCPSCRHNCRRCGRVVNAEDFVEELGLCPQCHDKEIDSSEDQYQLEASVASATSTPHRSESGGQDGWSQEVDSPITLLPVDVSNPIPRSGADQ